MSKSAAETLREKLEAIKNGGTVAANDPVTPSQPKKPVHFFEETRYPTGDTVKEYADIIGVPHPSGSKFFFTRGKAWFELSDWEARDIEYIPTDAPDHVIDHDYCLAILLAWEEAESVFAYGLPGCGKSVTPQVLAARCNRPFTLVNGFAGAEPSDYLGSVHIVGGNTEFIAGEAAIAIERGYTLMYDEPFKSSAQTNMWLQTLTDTRRMVRLYGHHDHEQGTLKAHPNFRLCLADNVRGVGDGMGQFCAEIQDQSTLDRTKYKVNVDYMPKEAEITWLMGKVPNSTRELTERVVDLAKLLRKGYEQEEFSIAFSVRQSLNLLSSAVTVRDPAMAFKLTYFDTLPTDEEKQAARVLFNDTVSFEQYRV